MSFIKKIKINLSNGIRIRLFSLTLELKISRSGRKRGGKNQGPIISDSKRPSIAHEISRNQVSHLMEKFPGLKAYFHEAALNDEGECAALLEFFYTYIKLTNASSRSTVLRDALQNLLNSINGETLREILINQYIYNCLDDGLAERANGYAGEIINMDGTLRKRLQALLDEHRKYYFGEGYDELKNFSNNEIIDILKDENKTLRGNTLKVFFENNTALFSSGQKVLHIAPEKDLRRFLNIYCSDKGIEYTTMDGFSPDVNFNADITSIDVPDDTFDVVICHRVLEHVMDDRGALKELYRILKKGGFLNISVPQGMYLEDTREWYFPEATTCGHVRQYGRDFITRLEEAGFSAQVENSLLVQSAEEHRRDLTYPMLMYMCYK